MVLDHAEHDGADEGQCEIRGDNGQFSDERTDESHWHFPERFMSLPAIMLKAGKSFRTEFRAEKVSPRCLSATAEPRRAADDVVKES